MDVLTIQWGWWGGHRDHATVTVMGAAPSSARSHKPRPEDEWFPFLTETEKFEQEDEDLLLFIL